MDPLSITASIITLLQLTHNISILCLDLHSTTKTAKQDILGAINEVKTLRSVLESLAVLTSNSSTFANLEKLAGKDGALTRCKTELEGLSDELAALKKDGIASKIQWVLKEKGIVGRLDNISKLKGTLQLALTVDQTMILIENRTQVMSIQSSIEDAKTEQLRLSIIEWLGDSSPASNLNNAQKTRSGTSGDWFLNRTDFTSWMDFTKISPPIWLHGIPGCGKTVLCSSVVEKLNKSCQSNNDATILYFFFDFADEKKLRFGKFLRSLLSQLQAQNQKIIHPLRTLYEDFASGHQQLTDRTLLDMLRDILECNSSTYIVIDAVDECDDREDILTAIEDIVDWKLDHLRLFAASREEQDIQEVFERLGSKQCRIEGDGVRNDLQDYVHQALLKDRRLRKWPGSIQTEILQALVMKGGEMFRWAVCQLEELRKCMTPKQLREALQRLPLTLEDTYSRILENIDPIFAEDARRMLTWLCFAKRPLTLDEMVDVLAVSLSGLEYDVDQKVQDPEDLLSICGSLVSKTDGELTLSHYSVKEFLVSQRIQCTGQSFYHITGTTAHYEITKTCLIYLTYFDRQWRVNNKQPFLDSLLEGYSYTFWPSHFREAGNPLDLQKLAVGFLDPRSSTFLKWGWLVGAVGDPLLIKRPEHVNCYRLVDVFLLYAVLIGAPVLVKEMLDRGADINAVLHSDVPLTIAAYRGDLECLRILLDRGADIDVWTENWGTALQEAAARGHYEVVFLLISRGADFNIECHYGSALEASITAEKNSEKCIKILLDAGADVNVSSDDFPGNTTPLEAAIFSEKSSAVNILLEHGANPSIHFSRALRMALSKGKPELAAILIGKGAEITAYDGQTECALFAAVIGGLSTLRLVIESHEGDYTWKDKQGRTLLHTAACGDHIDVIEYLLGLGLDPDQKDAKGWSSIHYAALTDKAANLRTLLPSWTGNPLDEESPWTPLHLACLRNEPEAMRLLYDSGFRASNVKTNDPSQNWNLDDIALAHRNSQLIGNYRQSLHDTFGKNNQQAEPSHIDAQPKKPEMKLDVSWECDGCNLNSNMVHSGPRFKCDECPDFDYCFICISSAEKTHKDHTFTISDELSWLSAIQMEG